MSVTAFVGIAGSLLHDGGVCAADCQTAQTGWPRLVVRHVVSLSHGSAAVAGLRHPHSRGRDDVGQRSGGRLVVISIVLKANPPAKQLKSVTRRLRIAVDMDEVIADSFSRHLGLYNQRAGVNLTAERSAAKDWTSCFPAKAATASTLSPMSLDFSLTSRSLPAARKRCWNCRAIMTSTSPAPPWKFLRRSRTSSSGWKRISLSFRPAGLCFAETRTSSTPMC